ncbi:ferric reductase-like transmembrane domain-containing protein [Thioclava indica]|uniref:Ferric oxidoreductase domain-containing protein n=1 Tax=Thioclava indica TaxID=1353528 RepID=A0A074JL37_9RHOB|nr:ferric reductase-like transmembrane domain-containing protein [Thioclava indica]KEO57184.1 hypothetical protein DT23_17095 [Thioclava indica]
MVLLVVQPLLVGGYLPGVPRRSGRYLHRWTGALLVTAVILHVAGLWRTSPSDMIDALLFVSPTLFSPWGGAAMWAIFAAALLAVFRLRGSLRLRAWRLGHSGLVLAAVLASVMHALLIEGTMGPLSKVLLCGVAIAAIAKVLFDLRAWKTLTRPRG